MNIDAARAAVVAADIKWQQARALHTAVLGEARTEHACALRDAHVAGLSYRQIGVLLDISAQRVEQVAHTAHGL